VRDQTRPKGIGCSKPRVRARAFTETGKELTVRHLFARPLCPLTERTAPGVCLGSLLHLVDRRWGFELPIKKGRSPVFSGTVSEENLVHWK